MEATGEHRIGDKTMHAIGLLVVAVLYLALRRRSRLRFPPGPPGLPLIGNMLMMDQLTHRGLAGLAKAYGGLVHLRLGFLHAFFVSTPEVAQEVLQAQDQACSNRPAGVATRYLTYDRSDMAFAHYGPFWRQMRKLCVMRLFSRRRVESWASVRDAVGTLVRDVRMDAGRPVNIGEKVFNLTMNVTFRAAFGSKLEEDQDVFIGILEEFSRLFGAFNVGDYFPWLRWMDINGMKGRLRTARRSLDGFIDRIIDDHMANRKAADAGDADMVDEMLTFLDEAPPEVRRSGADDLQANLRLTRVNIKAIVMDVMFGGTETVASTIEWALAELMHDPDEMRKVQEELADVVGLDRKVHESDLNKLPYLRCCIKETLRLHPPIPLLPHETAEDCVLSGYSIPARSRVMINVWAIGRDPSAWKDPDVFRPSRFLPGESHAEVDFRGSHFELLPFGSGRRSCPGMQLGLYALELAVANLLHCFTWELPNGMRPHELDMGDVFGLTAPRAVRLIMVPTPRLRCELL